ncbi:MAG: MFS transporter [Cytophagales bacterium]|nr:MFS transporter [Cytophagales bacterium]
MNYNKGLVFAASCTVIFLFGISLITLGAILPKLSADYNLSEIDKGTLASLLPVGILIGSLVFGPIVDRYSYKYFLAANVFLILAGFLLIAASKTFFHLAISFMLIGTGGGSLNGASSSLVSDFSDDHNENKGSNLSLMGAFFGLGALGMPLVLNLFSSWYDYREIIGGTGIFMLIPLIFLLAIRYPSPKQSGTISFKYLGEILKDGMLIAFSLVLFFEAGWESLLNNWLTTYLMEHKSFTESYALGLLTLFIAVFTIGRFVVGIMLKRSSASVVLIASSTVALAGCIILSVASEKLIIIPALCLIGFGLAAAFPVVLGIVGDRFVRWSGTAFGIALTIALLGNISINYFTGIITEAYEIGAYTWMVIITGICTSVLIIISFSKYK